MIRAAKISDIVAIAAAEKRYIECAWTERQLLDAFESDMYSFYIDEENGVLRAYGFIQWIADEGDVCNIAVDPAFRHTGKATGILKVMEEKAKERNVTRLFLEVSELNSAAIALYLKNGFRELYRRANYYGKNAAIVMEKTI